MKRIVCQTRKAGLKCLVINIPKILVPLRLGISSKITYASFGVMLASFTGALVAVFI